MELSTNFGSPQPVDHTVSQHMEQSYFKFPFQRSSSGSSALTFLPLDLRIKHVFKWQNQVQNEAEHLCTQLYSQILPHLSVPKAQYRITQKTEQIAREFFSKEVTISEIHHPLLLEYKDGRNLNKFAEYGDFFKLPIDQIQELFAAFGEIAGYDLLIGNSDRFLPLHFRGKIDQKHKINGGNIMVEVGPISSDPAQSPKIKSIHVIDNAPHFFSFFTYEEVATEKESSDDEDLFGGGCSLFGEPEVEENTEIPLEEDLSPSINGPDLREELHKDFEYFIHGDPATISAMARQIFIGICNELASIPGMNAASVKPFFSKKRVADAMHRSLCEGLQIAQTKLKALELQKVVVDIGQFSYTQPTSLMLLEFIKRNLKLSNNG